MSAGPIRALFFLFEAEEDKVVPVAARHFVSNGAERTEHPAVIFKAGN